jgi:hypothetical protein
MMNITTAPGNANFTGVGADGMSAGSLQVLQAPLKDIVSTAKAANPDHILTELKDEQITALESYLGSKIMAGAQARDRRLKRYAKIDRIISTWQKLSPEDSKREESEDATGNMQSLPFNLPVLATHLDDMVSYYAEALAPISNPFFSASGDESVKELLSKMNRDAAARDYYAELSLAVRSLLKYNLGGFRLYWDDAIVDGRQVGQPGNRWKGLDLYNTIWDASVKNPKNLACKGEFGATIEVQNRLDVFRKVLEGKYVRLEEEMSNGSTGTRAQFYKEPSTSADMTEDGQDQRTSTGSAAAQFNWGSYGLSTAGDAGPDIDGYETVEMCCWVIPAQFGLLTDAERDELKAKGVNPETHLELWEFTFVSGKLVNAEPHMDREKMSDGERVELPFYLSWLKQDQLKEAQRSFMELMRGFQRFSSAMYNIYVAGMKKNVWGISVVDESIVDATGIKKGQVTGVLSTKQSGRDVRAAFQNITANAGVDQALQAVDSALGMKDKFFPSQAMPAQVAGLDRAVKSQVAGVMQGATRGMRTSLRILDSSLMLPTRMGAYRNLKLYDKEGIDQLTDEDVAKLTGSGIESMEAERVSEVLWQLMYAIIQNQEAMQVFDVPAIMTYLGRVGNLSVDLGQFARQPPEAAGAQPTPPEQQPPAQA